jgi:heme/copper-type cytochrome/quinol oxidase subunit 2
MQAGSSTLLLIAWLACAAASAGFWWLYFTLHGGHSDRFNEAGRYLDEASGAVHDAQSRLLLMAAVVLLICAVGLALLWRARRRRGNAKPQG